MSEGRRQGEHFKAMELRERMNNCTVEMEKRKQEERGSDLLF